MLRSVFLRPSFSMSALRISLIAILWWLSHPSGVQPFSGWIFALLAIAICLAIRSVPYCTAESYVGIFAGNSFVLWWIPVSLADKMSIWSVVAIWLFLAAYSGIFPAMSLWIGKSLRNRGVPWSASVPLTWVLLEATRDKLFSGFDWLSTGYTGVNSQVLQHLYAHIGVHGVSGLVVALACYLIDIEAVPLTRNATRRILGICWVAALVVVLWSPCWCPTGESISSRTVRIGVLQATTAQNEWSSEIDALLNKNPDIVVTPEGFLPGVESIGFIGYNFLVGKIARCGQQNGRACVKNAVVFVNSAGSESYSYAKRALVPIYESDFAGIASSRVAVMVPGLGPGVAEVAGIRCGIAICYEVAHRWVIDELVDADVPLIVHPTSDSWQRGDAAALQHLNIARVRAAEAQIPILRVSNQKLTTLITPHGQPIQLIENYRAPAHALAEVDISRQRLRLTPSVLVTVVLVAVIYFSLIGMNLVPRQARKTR